MAQFNAIDISSYQGKPSWKKIRNAGIKIAILRAHQRYGIDESFEHNYAGAKANGILVGVYKFSYAMSIAESIKEANDTLEVLNGRQLDCPVFLDLEYEKQADLPKKVLEDIALAFLDTVSKAGYPVGIYCNVDWYENRLTETLKAYPMWLARYPFSDNGTIVERLRPNVGIGWQYSSKGTIPGIEGVNFDMDIFYTNFSGYKSPHAEAPTTTASSSEQAPAKALPSITPQTILSKAKSFLGCNEHDGSHRKIIDLYNSHKPLARGYAVQYNDPWCDTFTSAVFIACNAVQLIGGTECSVEEHVKIFKKEGIWEEDGQVTPEPAWIIVYNWDDTTQPNDGYSDHIGIVLLVDTVKKKTMQVIEGNYKDSVAIREIPIGWGYIRGYAKPKYAADEVVSEPETKTEPADQKKEEPKSGLSKEPKWVGEVTTSLLNVRVWAGTEYSRIQSYPQLKKTNLIDVCDEVSDSDGNPWYYVRISGKYYGFVSAEYIKRA